MSPPLSFVANNVALPRHFKRTLICALVAGLLNGPASAGVVVEVVHAGATFALSITGLGDEVLRGVDVQIQTLGGETIAGGDFASLQGALVAGPFTSVQSSPFEWSLGGYSSLDDAALAAEQADAFAWGWLSAPGAEGLQLLGTLFGRDGEPLDWTYEQVYVGTEPGTLALAGVGLVAAGVYRRRKSDRVPS